MHKQGKRAERWIAAALAGAVLCVGLVVSYAVYDQRATAHHAKLANEFEQTARQYVYLLQRQLDVYSTTGQTLAAFVRASADINRKDFRSFIKAATYFDRLEGISSLGYVAHVRARDAAAFERRAEREFPGYRIRESRPDADVLYPLLYQVHSGGEQRAAQLRGFDFASRPGRLATILTAETTGRAAVSPVLAAQDPRRPRVVFTFIPVQTLHEGARKDGEGGLVFVSMDARALFERVDDGRMLSLFDFEVYRVGAGAPSAVFDTDGVPHAIAGAGYSYVSQLHYEDQNWEVRFFPKPQYLAAYTDRYSTTVLALGVLLSLIAAYATFRLAHHYVGRHTSAELAHRFQAFFAEHPFAVYSLDRERRFVFANQKLARQLAVDPAALIGQPSEQFILPANRDMAEAHFREALEGQAVAYSNTIVNAKGESEDVSVVLFPVQTRGEVTHVLGFAENITERKRFERELYESRQKLQLVLDNVPLWVFWKDRNSVFQGANRRALDAVGLERMEQIVGRTDYELAWSKFAEQYRAEDKQVIDTGIGRINFQEPYQLADGSPGWLEVSKVPLRDADGTVVGLLGVAHDITDNKRLEAELLRRANHDSLTGLPNRAFFSAELRQAIKRAERSRDELALMYFDIDRFKQINDTFGHDTGDEAIRTFARRVRGVLRESDFLARLGGDEFVLVVEGLPARSGAAGVAEKIIAAMVPAFNLGECTHQASTSIGIAFLEPGMTADQLIKAADDAMYEAKRAGGNCYRQAPAQRAGQ